jgi:tRNA modification GTPase
MQIIEASALIEAGIDFSDEGDVPAEPIAPALAKIKTLLGEMKDVLAASGRGERLREGLVVTIAGPPNVGKSTLMNQLARREVAIVSPHAGTTRDVIEVQLDLDGYPVTVLDTAGIRETNDPVEQEGVRRARGRAAEADLVLWLADAESGKIAHEGVAPVWLVRNKIDLGGAETDAMTPGHLAEAGEFRISARRGDGVAELVAAMIGFAQEYFAANESGLISRERQRKLLQETVESLQRSLDMIDRGEELAAEDLRRAAYSLGRLLGRVDVEDILDVIFRDFCIGK